MSDRILVHLPSYYSGISDFVQMADTETNELNLIQDAIEQLFNDQFVMSSSLQAIKRVEQMLGIQADPAVETLNFRRRRILNRYQTKPPFTIRYLQQQLDMLVGVGRTVVSEDALNFVLSVTADIDNASVFREVGYTIEKIKPANMIYQQNTALRNTVALEEHISSRSVAWNYKLDGSWKLGERSFASLGQEVPIV